MTEPFRELTDAEIEALSEDDRQIYVAHLFEAQAEKLKAQAERIAELEGLNAEAIHTQARNETWEAYEPKGNGFDDTPPNMGNGHAREDPVSDEHLLQMRAAHAFAENFKAPAFEHRREDFAGARKLKIGYLSSDFCRHATALLMAELFERHDKSCFEIVAYSHGPDDRSELLRRLRGPSTTSSISAR
jgi:predicted O-linked N-acetylglucosamine transferase (SPINDLY family)